MSEFDKYKNEIPQDASRPEIPAAETIRAKNQEKAVKSKEHPFLDGTPTKDVEKFLISFLQVSLFFDLFEHIAGRCHF